MDKTKGWEDLCQRDKKIYLKSFHELYKFRDLVVKESLEGNVAVKEGANDQSTQKARSAV